MNRVYTANIAWIRAGESMDAWRNRSDGTSWAVGTLEIASSLQGVMDGCATRRRSEWGQQYHSMEIDIRSACARGNGVKKDPVRYRGRVKKCTLCKGAATERRELSVTI